MHQSHHQGPPQQHFAPGPSPMPPGIYPEAHAFNAGSWGHVPSKPKSSGLRVAAGIVSIVYSLFLALIVTATLGGDAYRDGSNPVLGWSIFLSNVALFGSLTMGIILIAKHRSRSAVTPSLLLGFVCLGPVGLIMWAASLGSSQVNVLAELVFVVPIAVLTLIHMIRSSRGQYALAVIGAAIVIAVFVGWCPALQYPGGGTYKSVEDLRRAYIQAGGKCQPIPHDTSHVEFASGVPVAEKMFCAGTEGTSMAIFSSNVDRDDYIANPHFLSAESRTLVGQNWAVSMPESVRIAKQLGGTLIEADSGR